MLVEVYTKPGCSLCDEMIDLFDEIDVQPVQHNIFEKQAWFDAYRYRIPVVAVEGREVLELRFTLDELKKALNT